MRVNSICVDITFVCSNFSFIRYCSACTTIDLSWYHKCWVYLQMTYSVFQRFIRHYQTIYQRVKKNWLPVRPVYCFLASHILITLFLNSHTSNSALNLNRLCSSAVVEMFGKFNKINYHASSSSIYISIVWVVIQRSLQNAHQHPARPANNILFCIYSLHYSCTAIPTTRHWILTVCVLLQLSKCWGSSAR